MDRRKANKLAALERQAARLERRLAVLRAASDRYSWTRLVIFIGGVAGSIALFYFIGAEAGWPGLLVTLVAFNVVASRQNRVEKSLVRFRFWLEFKKTQAARIRLEWNSLPPSSLEGFLPGHPFELDLDITGERSLHRLLNISSSREGSLRLRDWLLQTAPTIAATRQRQQLVRELAPLSLFRGKLLLAARLASRNGTRPWEGSQLLGWLQASSLVKPPTLATAVLTGLAGLNLGLFLLSRFGLIPNLWLLSLAAYFILFNLKAGETAGIYQDAFTLKDALDRLREVLKLLESYPYRGTPELKKLCQPLLDPRQRPSRELKAASRIVAGVSLQKNGLLWLLLNLLVPWRFYFALLLFRAKNRVKHHLPGWLEVWFELEALNSLANFAGLNPEYTFPAFAGPEKPFFFNGEEMGHPLIPAGQKVCNDFYFDRKGELVIITGSNMAGKSSFLKTLGVNLALAYAGGVTNAASLETAFFRLFSCIKVTDSVTDGFSYFYAEVRRLKALLNAVEEPGPFPVFYLIDEIFRGTNNRERLVGSRAYLLALAGKPCVGFVSTHDLDLIKLAEASPLIQNFHFREEVEEARLVFDYKIRPGPSPTTNALLIMRLEGLPVPPVF